MFETPEEIKELQDLALIYFRGYDKEGNVIWAPNTPKEAIEAREKAIKLWNEYVGWAQ